MNSAKATDTTTVVKIGGNRKERHHVCAEGTTHPLSAHDEQGKCHADGCDCPGYAAKKGDDTADETAPAGDARDAVTSDT